MLDGLGGLVGGQVRLWHDDGRRLRLAGGSRSGLLPEIPVPVHGGPVVTPEGTIWLEPVPGMDGYWLELGGIAESAGPRSARTLLPVVGALLDAERDRSAVAKELANRYEEIDLLYAISEILGRTSRLEDATHTIVREVSAVVGARRASVMVYDEGTRTLRTVAARGMSAAEFAPVSIEDPSSVAARAFREQRMLAFDPGGATVTGGSGAPSFEAATDTSSPGSGAAAFPGGASASTADDRAYRGEAYLSVPICYGPPGAPLRCIGVINLTDRIGGDRFTPADRKLVTAVANQVGAAVERSRLVDRDRRQEQVRRELELAHDLQLQLLPPPTVLQGDAEVAARCVPADSVGGDFYTFARLGRGRVGVMVGDVASHGFSAALIMALVIAAAGIHAGAGATPDETLAALLDSLAAKLTTTDMHVSMFYGVLDPEADRLVYSNAGHPHAFRIPQRGAPERLGATSPPLGLAMAGTIERRQVAWCRESDLLCLWTDGLVEARNDAGVCYGEARLLEQLIARRADPPETIVDAVMADASAFGTHVFDDRTLLVLRL